MTGRKSEAREPLPVNNAPYTTILYTSLATGRHVRSRIVSDIGRIPFEFSDPIRTFPTYRQRRAHQGHYWFSRSESHVKFESRFEMTALMALDFAGHAVAVSSNPFWLLWPKGVESKRHAPDFFVRERDGLALVVDVKPKDRMTERDRSQHARTREICSELGWRYEEFTEIEPVVERNLRLLSAYHHRRFRLPDSTAARLRTIAGSRMRLGDLVDASVASLGTTPEATLCGIYHMLWSGELHINKQRLLSWETLVWP